MKHVFFTLALLFSMNSLAAPAVKYKGSLSVEPNVIHKEGVKGQVDLVFEGDKIVKVDLKTEKPVYGKTQFASSEQAVFSRTIPDVAQMAVVFKLQGAPHKWYFVYIGTTADQGATYVGELRKVPSTMDSIVTALTAGKTPQDWKIVGKASLKNMVQ